MVTPPKPAAASVLLFTAHFGLPVSDPRSHHRFLGRSDKRLSAVRWCRPNFSLLDLYHAGGGALGALVYMILSSLCEQSFSSGEVIGRRTTTASLQCMSLNPHLSPMSFHNMFHDGEAESGSSQFA